MTQDRSTLAERMAKNVAEARQHGCHYAEGTCDQCASIAANFIATLEGMAAPGAETTRKPDVPCPVTGNDACEFGYCRETPGCYLKECGYPLRTGDAPSPQQPTPEALEAAIDHIWPHYNDRHMPKMEYAQGSVACTKLALLLDRFAAQRVTAAPSADVVEWAHQVLRDGHRRHLREPPGGKNLTLCEVDAIAAALTAATDKARREALDALQNLERDSRRVINNARACGYRDAASLRIDATPMWDDFEASVTAAREMLRTTPQNPGDGDEPPLRP